jgi:allantoinase
MTAAEQSDLAMRSSRVVKPRGEKDAVVFVQGGKISQVVETRDLGQQVAYQDLADLVVSPGVVDIHVHVNEPGRTAWEGFQTATRAASAGGVTTIVDMPLNSSPVTTTVAALHEKLAAARDKCACDVGFHGGLIPGNHPHLRAMIDAGVLAIKAFLCPSGLDEFPAATESDLRAAMPILAERNLPLLVHCELPTAPAPAVMDPRSYAQYCGSRPDQWEMDAIAQMIELCRGSRCHVHIVHLSTVEALPLITAAKNEGLPLSVETCPHYL